MRCFKMDFNNVMKILLLSKEHLIPPRPHLTRQTDSYVMYFIINGELILDNNGEVLTLGTGDICIFASGDDQKPARVSDCEYYYVHFDIDTEVLNIPEKEFPTVVKQKNSSFAQPHGKALERYGYMSVFVPSIMHITEAATFDYFYNTLKKYTHSFLYNSIEKRLELSYDMMRLFLRLEKMCAISYSEKSINSKGVHETIQKIVEYIDGNFLLDIGGEEIEERFLMNFDYANRLFKQIVGKSIVKYRNDLRIEYAKHLLLTTEKPIGEVAYEAGFKDRFYFTRFFTKCVGVAPKYFRGGE